MAVTVTITVDGNDYGFDFSDSRIDIDAAVQNLDVSDLWTAIKQAQADQDGIIYDQVAVAEGLTELSTGISTFITVNLLDVWEINTLRSSGKFQVQGGNLVRNDGEDPFRDNPLITYINNLSQAGVVTTVSTGSGLSSEQDATLTSINSKLGTPSATVSDDIAALPTATENADALLGRNIAGGSSTGRTVTQALRPNRNRIDQSDTEVTVYEEDDTTISHTYTVTRVDRDQISNADPD